MLSALDAVLVEDKEILDGNIVGYRELLVAFIPLNSFRREGILLVCDGFCSYDGFAIGIDTGRIIGCEDGCLEGRLIGLIDGWQKVSKPGKILG